MIWLRFEMLVLIVAYWDQIIIWDQGEWNCLWLVKISKSSEKKKHMKIFLKIFVMNLSTSDDWKIKKNRIENFDVSGL